MAQHTSDIWKELIRKRNTSKEYAFDINGVWYGPEAEVTHSVDNSLYDSFGIGNAMCATLTMNLYTDSVPRAAVIKRYVRLVNGTQISEWLPKGTFYTNHRTSEDGYWTIEAYDAMLKADVPWNPDQSLVFPLAMDKAVDVFAKIMGVEIDPRTYINPAYTIDYPATDQESEDSVNNNYTIRQELQWIAASHGGNWIITDEEKLLLVPLGGEPDETHYLVTEYGDAIVIGGVRILV